MSPLKKEVLPASLQGRLLFGDATQIKALKELAPKKKKKVFKQDPADEIVAILIRSFGGKEVPLWSNFPTKIITPK